MASSRRCCSRRTPTSFPFDTAQWTVDPLGGEIKDGWVYGRGAMDFKGGLAVFATAVLRIAKEQLPLNRDVILLAEAEEEGGTYNTEWLAGHHWDKIDAGMALNEGGWILKGPDGKPAQVTISTADKIYAVLALRIRDFYEAAARQQPSPTDTDLYRALVDQASAQWPTAAVAPGLFEAGTDASAWRSRGVPVYGIYPYPMDNDTLERMHGNDERIEASSLREGAEMTYRTLRQVAAP